MNRRLAVLLVLGIALRAWLWWAIPHEPRGDALLHQRIALNLLNGHGFSHSPVAPFYPDANRSPLVPLLLMAVGGWEPAFVWLQILMDVATGLLLFHRVRRLFGENRGIAAAGLFWLSPYSSAYSGLLLTETTATFLLALFLELCFRCVEEGPASARQWIAPGAVGALVGLCRPTLMPVVLVGLLMAGGARDRSGGRARQVGAALLTMVALLAPWTIRNALVFGRPAPFNVSGLGIGLYFGVTYDREIFLTCEGGPELMELLGQWSHRGDVPPERVLYCDDRLKAIALAAIRQHPVAYAQQVAIQAGSLYWLANDGVLNPHPSVMQLAMQWNTIAMWSQRLLLGLALVGLVRHARSLLGVWLLMALVAAVYAPIHVEPRYMLPLQPALACAAALAVVRR